MASGAARLTPPHASWPQGGCAVGGLTLSRACVCVHTSVPGGSCLHPLSPLAGGSRGFTARDGVEVSPPGTQTHKQTAMPSMLPMALGFCRLSQQICSSPACSALGKERAWARGLWALFCPILCSQLLWGLSVPTVGLSHLGLYLGKGSVLNFPDPGPDLRFLPGPECVREPPLTSSWDSRP